MAKLITFCLFLFTSVLYGQERITEFDSQNKIIKSFVTQTNSNHFIVSVNNHDNIEVFEIIEKEPIKKHSTVIDGAYDSAIQAEEFEFLLFKNAKGGSVYNIINNSILDLEFDEGYCEIEWRINNHHEIIMLQLSSDGALKKYEIINLKTNERTHLDTEKDVLEVSENAVLSRVGNLYFVENRNTNALDSFMVDYVLYASYHFMNDNFIFVSDNDFYRFDAVSREKKLIHSNNTSGSKSGIRGDKNVILYKERPWDQGFNLDVVFLDDSFNIINILNLDEFDNLELYNYYDLYFVYEFIANKVTFWFREKMYVLSIENGSYKSFDCSSVNRRSIVKLDQNNIICRQENDLLKINMFTLSEEVIAQDLNLPSYTKNLKVDNELLLLGNEDIYAIDQESSDVETRNSIPIYSDGIRGYAQLFNVGEDVILAEDGLFWLPESGINQISTNKVVWGDNPFEIKNDAFYWFEINGSIHDCFKFKNGLVTKIATVNNLVESDKSQLREFFILEDEVFYIRKDEKSIYKCTDSNIGEIVDNHGSGSYLRIFTTDKHIIYDYLFKIRAIDKEGTVHILDDEYAFNGYFLQQYRDNIFINRPQGIKKVGIDGAEFIHDGEGSLMFALDQSIIIIFEESILVYEEDFVDTVSFLDNYNNLSFSNNSFTCLSKDDAGENAYFWYNNSTRSLLKLDMLDTNHRIIDVVQHNENYLFFTTDKVTQQGVNLNIYQMNHDGSEWKTIIDFPIYLDNYEINFRSIGDKGLLLANDYICLIDEFSEINRFQNIKGEYYNQEIIEAGEYLYFMADDELYGRQVYRIYYDVLIGSKHLDINQVSIYPNPSSAYLNIDNLNSDIFTKFEIFNTQGDVFKFGNIQRDVPIDIIDLDSGYYVIKLIGRSRAITKVFIKMD